MLWMLLCILLIHIRVLVFKLDQASIGVLIALLLFIWMVSLMVRMATAAYLFLFGRRPNKDLDWGVLSVHILTVDLVLLDLIPNLRCHTFEIGGQGTALSVLILRDGALSGYLGVVLLASLLGLSRPGRRMLKDHV